MSPHTDRIDELAALYKRNAAELTEAWLERASIRQHLGGYSRAEAERLALADIESELAGR